MYQIECVKCLKLIAVKGYEPTLEELELTYCLNCVPSVKAVN
jgi:hypothetical protein